MSETPTPVPQHINREISWLSFNGRVLQEAADPTVPLVERLRFLGIYSNNLDEFFRVRVATLKRMQPLGAKAKAFIGESPAKVLAQIQSIVIDQQRQFGLIYHSILEGLRAENIFLVDDKGVTAEQAAFARSYFVRTVRPNLIPVLLDETRKFPYLTDHSVYLAVRMTDADGQPVKYATVELPSKSVSRFLELPPDGDKQCIMLLDDVIRLGLRDMFQFFDFEHIEAFTIKVTRDAELDMDDDISKGFMEKMAKSLRKRKQGSTVRFIYDSRLPENFLQLITSKMKLKADDNLIRGGRYHNFKDFIGFPNMGSSELEHKKIVPLPHPDFERQGSLLNAIAEKDILLHYPYQSFDYFINVMRDAAIDPDVSSMKITVYRLAAQSKVVNALLSAAANGKKVTVIIELQARFDEEANIYWAKELEAAGVRVIFGVSGLKVHSKMLLITRKEDKKSVRYACVSTGNFNESTARFYTDHALFTADRAITEEVNHVFRFFDVNYKIHAFEHLVVSPFQLRDTMSDLIDREISNAKAGKQAWITFKLNNLVDLDVVAKLYEASSAGVKINLICRGVCSLVPGVPGLSENITVVSIVDKFLEHSRVFVFCNAGENLFYLSSADLMPRNIDIRVEVSCPVKDPRLQKELWDTLQLQLKDNVKARVIDETQGNIHVQQQGEPVRAQLAIYDYLKQVSSSASDTPAPMEHA